MLIGTASATLLGLMFVAVSITASYMTEELRPGLAVFLSPTIFHLALTLVVCVILLLPAGPAAIGVLALLVTLFGLAYATRVLRGVQHFYHTPEMGVDNEDRVFYGLSPVICQLVLVVSATLMLYRVPSAAWTFIAALVALLLVCIRNAWDITVWAVIRAPNR